MTYDFVLKAKSPSIAQIEPEDHKEMVRENTVEQVQKLKQTKAYQKMLKQKGGDLNNWNW